jgi:hypothetical protein
MTKQIDLLVFSLLFLLSSWIWLFFKLKPLFGFLLITVVPITYLGLRELKPWRRILFASFVLGAILGAVFDLIQSFNNSWVVNLVIPWKIFNVLPIDNILGYILMTLLTLIFYIHFFLPNQSSDIPKRFYILMCWVIGVATIVFVTFLLKPSSFLIRYPYLFGGLVAVTVPVSYLVRHPKSLNNILRIGAYFFFVWFLTEIIALKTDGWGFAGEFVGWISVFGVSFPFEELFFWMFWYAPFLVAAYGFLMGTSE